MTQANITRPCQGKKTKMLTPYQGQKDQDVKTLPAFQGQKDQDV